MEPMIFTIALWLIAVLCIAAGIAGTIFPALPGSPLIFVGILIGAWANDFTLLGWPTLVISGFLAIAALAVDFIATALGAQKVGASGSALLGATIGTFAGLPFSIPGIVLGPFVGAVAGEVWAQRKKPDYWQISKVGVGTWIGLLIGTIAKVALVAVMVGVLIMGLSL
jgi:uncharacterized protein YqgC (DUF456 family)